MVIADIRNGIHHDVRRPAAGQSGTHRARWGGSAPGSKTYTRCHPLPVCIPHSSGRNRSASCSAACLVSSRLNGSISRCAGRVVLSQSMALPGGRQQYAIKIGMIGKFDAEHVPGLAFIPVGVGPNVGNCRYFHLRLTRGNLEPDLGTAAER